MAPQKRKRPTSADDSEDNDELQVARKPRKAVAVDDGDDDEQDVEGNNGEASDDDQDGPRRKKKAGKGGFAVFGLSHGMLKSVTRKGFKLPTPIQRKAIPSILDGRDVVGMARTGSGKTAAFVIPLVERLKMHSAKVGARALVLSPSRELALQTLKVVKELSKHTDLRSCMVVGGDGLEEQFGALASNPDIIIATPGRFMHILIEMNLDLKTVEYVVFDEADRLFELGFAQQLTEILHKLPPTRQTLLFSATLPKILADFAKAGLSDPVLVRLDTETKVSPDLETYFFSVPPSARNAVLLYLLRDVIPAGESTIVFVSTKHHAELLQMLLDKAAIANTYIYGSLDQTARKTNLARFRSGAVKLLIVTDVAARGVDIPLLDNVINYDFPPTTKSFVHRVGRVARAGRRGRAYSLVSADEYPYFVDLQLFLGRRLVHLPADIAKIGDPDYTQDLVMGTVPQFIIDNETEYLSGLIRNDATIDNLVGVCGKAYKLYIKTRPAASKESFRRAKEMKELAIHPALRDRIDPSEQSRAEFVASISKFRPSETVFEIGKRGTNVVMQSRRKAVAKVIERAKSTNAAGKSDLNGDGTGDVDESFVSLGASEGNNVDAFRDPQFYLSYEAPDADTERGYAMTGRGESQFTDAIAAATGDLVADDPSAARAAKGKGKLVWDKTKRNFVRETLGSDNVKRIKTESGQRVPASFKSNKFAEWQKKTKISLPRSGERELEKVPFSDGRASGAKKYRHTKIFPADPNSKRSQKRGKGSGGPSSGSSPSQPQHSKNKPKRELRTAEEMLKQRKLKEKRREKTGRHGVKFKKGGSKGKGGGKGGKR